MSTTTPAFPLPRARLPALQQPPLDSITVYDTATHCYLLGTDSLQKNFILLSCRKHAPVQMPLNCAGGNKGAATHAGNDDRQSATVSESGAEEERGGAGTTLSPSASHVVSFGLDDLHDFTSYAVYSPTEAGALVDALQREHGALMRVLSAVAFLGAVRFTAGYYVVLVTDRRLAGYLGVHRIFEAASVELVSLQLDPEWVAEAESQSREQAQRLHRGDGVGADGFEGGLLPSVLKRAATGGWRKASSPFPSRLAKAIYNRKSFSYAGTGSSASATSYLFSRRNLEKQYRQQFISSLSRASSFFYSHSYDLTNTLQRNMLAAGSAASDGTQATAPVGCATGSHPPGDRPLQPRMQYVWNDYLLEPWRLNDRDLCSDETEMSEDVAARDDFDAAQRAPSTGGAARETVPQYPSALSRWRVFLVHGYVTQRVVAIRYPAFQTLLITLIARVSKGSAGVRYLRRGINSDGHVANHVEVEQIVSDESSWNSTFTAGALSSYIQLRGSVPVRWYHPPTASRLLPKPPIVIGPHDSQWSETCLHFQKLVEQYGCPIIVHDLLKRKEHKAREGALGDAYREAVRALVAAVDRAAAASTDSAAASRDGAKNHHASESRIYGTDVLQYESTDLRSLSQLAWNTMTVAAEQHFRAIRCFVSRRCSPSVTTGQSDARGAEFHQSNLHRMRDTNELVASYDGSHSSDSEAAEVVQLQYGVVRSNCLDCIDRTNLGQLFHGIHALGEQLSALGLLQHAADLCDSPAVMEMLLEMYLAMGDAIAIQYGGSAQVGAGVLYRGAGWDQLMGVKRLYNNVMGDRDKQEAMNLLLGRKQPHPRRGSRACNAEMRSPAQIVPLTLAQVLPSSTAAWAGVGGGSPAREAAVAPSASLFSGIRKAASRWWSEAVSSSTSPSGGSTAATALWPASYAAAEAEAEADYYEQVSSAPRLPPAGLLASWWVKPLRRFEEWYAACGAYSRPRALGNGNTADSDTQRALREVTIRQAPCRSPVSWTSSSYPAATHGSLPMPCVRMPTCVAEVVPDVYSGDELALRLLAAETQAQEDWLLFIAKLERQSCLAPPRRDDATQLFHDRRKGRSRDGWSSDRPAARYLFSLSSPVAVKTPTSGFPMSPQTKRCSLEGNSTLQGFTCPSGQDDVGELTTVMRMATSASRPGATPSSVRACDKSHEESALLPVSETTHSLLSIPSLTAPLRLFTEPWVVLHTTTHVLPIVSATAANSQLTPTPSLSTAALCSGGLSGSSRRRAALYEIHDVPCCELSYSIRQAVAHQLFGGLPPAVAVVTAHSPRRMLEEQHQLWRSPRRTHPHDIFPQIVRNSVFAQQNAHLEELAYREVLWMIEGAGMAGARGRSALAESSMQPASGVSMTPLSSPAMFPWALSPHEVADQQCIAALIVDRFGAPATWGLEDIIQVLRYLVYPERLTEEVLQVLRSRRVQPPLEGAELLLTSALVGVEENEGKREQRWYAEVRRYWRERLVTPLDHTAPIFARDPSDTTLTQVSTPTPSLRGPVGEGAPLRQTRPTRSPAPSNRLGEKVGADGPVHVAASLLCRLASVLHFAEHNNTDRVASVVGAMASSPVETVRGSGASVATFKAPRGSYVPCRTQGRGVAVMDILAATAQDEGAAPLPYVEDALLPLLEAYPHLLGSASAHLPGLFPQHKNLADSLRRQWILCGLLQPIFPRILLTPPTLHDLLRAFFSALLLDDDPVEGPADRAAGGNHQRRRRCDRHVRYTFALSHPQLKPVQQWTSLQLSSDDTADEAGGGGSGGDERFPYRLFIGNSALRPPSLPQGLPSAHGGSASSVSTAGSRTLHIPATLKVQHCCAALDLYRWSVAHTPFFSISPAGETRYAPVVSSTGGSVKSDTAVAAWRLLWWAVDNSLVVPVVRRRGQGTLEMLADETALFSLKRDVVRVALNVERHCREDVWCPQQSEVLACSGKMVPGSSAIYGVDLTPSVLRLYRPLCRSTLVGILALSENLASLGLSAATRVQEFFRDRIVHGWARQSIGSVVVATSAASTPVLANASSGTSVVTAATVVRRFQQLAEECLRSVHSVMVALRHVSLEAFARDAAMHSYIGFFVNVYNAAYVAAWITNVKELVSSGAAAATAADANSPQNNHSHPPNQGFPRRPKLRSIDLFPLPTLCNTNYACFMHAYGVVIGGVFLSLEEMKYGILGGNRAPPYCNLPLWPPISGSGASQCCPSRHQRSSEINWRQQVQRLVPLHLCAEVAESARLDALQRHPHLQAALDFTDMCEALDPCREEAGDDGVDGDGAHAESSKPPSCSRTLGGRTRLDWGSSPHLPCVVQPSSASSMDITVVPGDSTRQDARGPPSTAPHKLSPEGPPYQSDADQKRHRRQKLVDVWSLDVVRYLPFRILLQLIDTYLPPPVFHMYAGGVDMEGRESFGGSIGGGDASNASGSTNNSLARDPRCSPQLDGRDTVPWFLQPILNNMPLVHSSLQCSKVGATYTVACDGDGPPAGTLMPQVSQDANGVLLQQCRMWNSPSYYIVGGDGTSSDEAVSRSFQLLQALAGSYLGAGLYHPIGLGTMDRNAADAPQRGPAPHLCLPLHADDPFAQLLATEAAFRSALVTTDPHIFRPASASPPPPPAKSVPQTAPTSRRLRLSPSPLALPTDFSQPPHLRSSGGAAGMYASAALHGARALLGGSGTSNISYSATLQNTVKPLLYELCRSLEAEITHITSLPGHEWQVRATLKLVRLLEESYVSGMAVRAAQAAMRSA
ncbi:hypothetical protein JKF63_05560 [Porcisia hertigi]|uniref:SAC domain-containing protein n=1 Tax=Porcisia hertigi TaxID=2761500 RepID=A0A836L8Z0_9TRYP|nr:hypothetical protein JKF63_05560 [Porcisia hertigi]